MSTSSTSTDTDTHGEGKRLALVIGVNSSTESSLAALTYAEADAEAMAQVLEHHCGFELFEHSPLIGDRATTSAIQRAVRRLAREREDDDFLLLYFAGHALPMIVEADQRDVFLVTHDFDAQDVDLDENAHLSLRWLRKMLYERTNAGRVLIVLDCCFAGEMGANAPDQYLEELKERIRYYLGETNKESRANLNGQRLALSATAHNTLAGEEQGHGVMTENLLSALQGDQPQAFDREGEVSIELLYNYLKKAISAQPPDLSGNFANRSCVLATFAERARALRAQLQHTPSRGLGAERPETYIPFPRNPLFQPRPDEFEQVERLLVKPDTGLRKTRVGLVGVTGMGGIGKTQLAVELAYRLLEQHHYPGGIFWMPATGRTLFDWQRDVAGLAFNTGYLPPNDDQTHPENEAERARHLCRYLAHHADALLILDNVEDPELISSILPSLAGREMACAILYTSRKTISPPGTALHPVTRLPPDAALRLLLATSRPLLLEEVKAEGQSTEIEAARLVCQRVGYLPLAVTHLRGRLEKDKRITCVRLAEVLQQRGSIDIMQALFTTFRFSWEQISDERSRRLFLLASYFPEAMPIPLWLLGVAAGLGESADSFEPLGEASLHLQELSLFEELSGEQVRLHPLVREFGQKLAHADRTRHLERDAQERILASFTDLNALEQRALHNGCWACLDQIRATRDYVGWLTEEKEERVLEPLQRMERWLDRESYLLTDGRLWPGTIPGLFFQQLYNRSVEVGAPLIGRSSAPWLRQQQSVGAEDRALLRTLSGHTSSVSSVAFSPDGRVAVTCDSNGQCYFWRSSGAEMGTVCGMYPAVYSVGAVYWVDERHVLLADTGGSSSRWYLYRLALEREW
jgi:Caspase domain/NB-ARC domain/WD domain, G-beta repeat